MKVHESLLLPLASGNYVNKESNEQIDVFKVFFIFKTISTIKKESLPHTWRKHKYCCPRCSWMLSLLIKHLRVSRMGASSAKGAAGSAPRCGVPTTLSPLRQQGWDVVIPALRPWHIQVSASWNFDEPNGPIMGINW